MGLYQQIYEFLLDRGLSEQHFLELGADKDMDTSFELDTQLPTTSYMPGPTHFSRAKDTSKLCIDVQASSHVQAFTKMTFDRQLLLFLKKKKWSKGNGKEQCIFILVLWS